MAQKIKIELNRNAIRQQLLKSPEIQDICKEHADNIANRCGDGYKSTEYMESTRIVAKVYTDSFRAMHDNMKNNTLLKAVKG